VVVFYTYKLIRVGDYAKKKKEKCYGMRRMLDDLGLNPALRSWKYALSNLKKGMLLGTVFMAGGIARAGTG